jgi:hypothetical protein
VTISAASRADQGRITSRDETCSRAKHDQERRRAALQAHALSLKKQPGSGSPGRFVHSKSVLPSQCSPGATRFKKHATQRGASRCSLFLRSAHNDGRSISHGQLPVQPAWPKKHPAHRQSLPQLLWDNDLAIHVPFIQRAGANDQTPSRPESAR